MYFTNTNVSSVNLLADGLPVIEWCFSIRQSQPSLLLKQLVKSPLTSVTQALGHIFEQILDAATQYVEHS